MRVEKEIVFFFFLQKKEKKDSFVCTKKKKASERKFSLSVSLSNSKPLFFLPLTRPQAPRTARTPTSP